MACPQSQGGLVDLARTLFFHQWNVCFTLFLCVSFLLSQGALCTWQVAFFRLTLIILLMGP